MGQNKNFSTSGLLTGALLIIVGICWILINYDILDFSVWRLWPLTLIFIGVAILLKEKTFNHPMALMMVFFGGTILVANLDLIEDWHLYDAIRLWPVALIIFGVSMIINKTSSDRNVSDSAVDSPGESADENQSNLSNPENQIADSDSY